jgi:hypothetical protein
MPLVAGLQPDLPTLHTGSDRWAIPPLLIPIRHAVTLPRDETMRAAGEDKALRGIVRGAALALLVYLAISFLFFGRGVVGHFSDYYLGRDTDPSLYIWSLSWWLYVLQHHVHPFFTKLIWAPYGINLAWVTTMPLMGVVAAPIQATFGPLATFNLLSLLVLPACAFSAYILLRQIGGSPGAAFIGGLVFGFSPYMVAQLLSHFILLLMFPVPIAVYLVIRRLDGTLSRGRFVIFLALTLVAQFLLLLELTAVMTFIGAVAIAVALRLGSREERSSVLSVIPEIAAAYALTALLVSPYVYYFFAFGFPSHPLWPPWEYSADLLNFVIPSEANAVGANRLLEAVSSRYSGNIYEQGACLGIPLILMMTAWARRHWDELRARVLASMVVIISVFAAGPFLNVAGHPIAPMPWLLLERLPLLKSALPCRLMPFAFLAASAILTLWIDDPRTHRWEKIAGISFTLLMLLPNPAASFWASPDPTPAFFRDGSSRRMLSHDDIVLPLPYGQKGMSMLWQVESGMNFRMASGLTGLQPIEMKRWPIMNVVFGAPDLPDPALQLKAFIANTGITAIVIDKNDPDLARWKHLFAPLDVTPIEVSGVLFYRIPGASLNAYRNLDALEMERRADRGRFEILVAAASKYLADGKPAASISLYSLQASGLLPPDWVFDPDRRYRDVYAGFRNGDVAIGVVGSESGVKPIIDSYSAYASAVYFPFPHKSGSHGFFKNLLAPEVFSSTTGETLQLLMMTFDTAQLRSLAAKIAERGPVNPDPEGPPPSASH